MMLSTEQTNKLIGVEESYQSSFLSWMRFCMIELIAY